MDEIELRKENYTNLTDRLKGQIGNQVLVVDQRYHTYRGVLGGGLESEHKNWILNLGILTPGISTDNPIEYQEEGRKITLPTNRYVVRDGWGRGQTNWKLEEGDITIPCKNGFNYLESYTSEIKDLSEKESMLLILAGEEIPDFFRNYGDPHFLIFSRVPEKRSEYEKLLESAGYFRNDFSYVEALKLLGQEAPEDFVAGYNQKKYEAKVGLIRDLERLVGEETKLTGKKDSAYKPNDLMSKREHFAFGSGSQIIKEIQRVQKRINANLRQAVELGMHNREWNLEGDIPEETLDVPVYISSLCDKYRPEISS